MKSLRCCLILILLGLSSSAALADGIPDPVAKVGGGSHSPALFGPDFAFTIHGGSSPQPTDFINATGRVAVGMDLLITLIPGTRDLTFFCDPSNPYFTDCNPKSPGMLLSGTGSLLIHFFGLDAESGHNGIPNDPNPSCVPTENGPPDCTPSVLAADFAVIFADASATNKDLTNLPPTEGFLVKGTLLLPEPSAILLVLAGGVLLFFSKRFWGISVPRLGS